MADEATKIIEQQFQDKVNQVCQIILERDPQAQIQFSVEDCQHPEHSVEREVFGEVFKTPMKTRDTVIEVWSHGIKSKYAVWINDDGTFGWVSYVR